LVYLPFYSDNDESDTLEVYLETYYEFFSLE